MNIATYIQTFRKLPHLMRQLANNGAYAVNEELFWDQYVQNWEKSERNAGPYLGSEWKHDEDFVALLQRHGAKDKSALEVGCGGGRVTARAVQVFQHVYAADVSAEMLRKSKEAIDAPNISFHKLDGFTLEEFGDATVDFVYSHDVFVQLSSIQVYPYLLEIGRVLKPGGIGLVSCYDFTGQFELFKEWSLRFWKERKRPVYRRLHFLTEEMLRAMLSDLGMETVAVQKRRFLIVTFRK